MTGAATLQYTGATMKTLPLLCALVAGASSAVAADYPLKPIRIVVSETPGAGSDILARQAGSVLTEAFGQQTVVDNRPGASGLIGAELVAKAQPDGYTLWAMSLSQLVGTVLYQRLQVGENFAPVSLTAQTTSAIAVNAALPVNTVAELIAYAKARPGQVLYGSAGNVTSMHLCMEMLKLAAGVNLVHVPYKGAAPMLTDLAGGQVQAACVPVAPLQPLVKTGRLRALAVTSATRTALAPGLAPVADTLPGFELNGWYGLLAPRGTPPAVVARIHAALANGMKTPAVTDKLAAMGVEPVVSAPVEFAAFLRTQTAKWQKLLQDANIRAD